jgi:hypothetical protein
MAQPEQQTSTAAGGGARATLALLRVPGHPVPLGGARLPGIGPVGLATESWGPPPSAVQQCKPPSDPLPLLLGQEAASFPI